MRALGAGLFGRRDPGLGQAATGGAPDWFLPVFGRPAVAAWH